MPSIGLSPIGSGPCPGTGSGLSVLQTFLLCPGKGFFSDKDSLPFVTLPRPTKSYDHGPEFGVLPGPASKRSIATGEKGQVVEVSAWQAKRVVVLKAEEAALTKFLPALVTC